jgi:hypothetical protein
MRQVALKLMDEPKFKKPSTEMLDPILLYDRIDMLLESNTLSITDSLYMLPTLNKPIIDT